MADNSDSDVEFPLSRKRKLGVIDVSEEDDDESDDDDGDDDEGDDDEDMDSEGEDEEGESDEEESGDDDDDVVNDVDITDDENSDQCAICLMEFTKQLLGIPDSCAHVFCSVCIQEWAKNINTCPVDRKVFHVIAIRATSDGPQIDQIKVEDRTNIEEEYEDPTSCEVCGIGDREDRMLLCDGCDRGFHLECMTPPLDNVPDGEWFCPDCSSFNSARIDCDAVMDVETSSIPLEPEISTELCSSRASTSSGRRARTVATTRGRRRSRGQTRTRQTRTRQTRRRAQRGKSSSKRGSSSRGASTSTTRGKRKTKRKRRKGKRKRKTRGTKVKSEEKSGSKRSRFDVSPSRYVLPHEMEASSSFSLFGNDFGLEYLPYAETPAPIAAAPKSEDQRTSANSNPDLLGSIFSGLNALHDVDLKVDAKGSLTVSQDAENNTNSESRSDVSSHASCKQEYPLSATNANTLKSSKIASSSSSSNEFGNKTDGQNMAEQHGKAMIKTTNRDVRDTKDRKDNTCYANVTIPDINEKRIKRFDTPERSCGGIKTVYKGDEGLNVPELTRKSKTTAQKHSSYVGKNYKYGETSYTTKRPDTNALSTYKIPRKKPTPSSSISEQVPKAATPFIEVTKECEVNKCEEVGNTTSQPSGYKDVGFSQPNKDVMVLLSQASSRSQCPTDVRVEDSKSISSIKITSQGSVPVSNCDIQKTPWSIGSISRGITSCVRDVDVQKADIVRVDKKPVSSMVVYKSEKTNMPSAKCGDDAMLVRNLAFKSLNSSCGFNKIIQENSDKSAVSSGTRQTATNRSIIDMINRRKSVLSDNDSDNTNNSSTRTATPRHSNTSPKQFPIPNSATVLGKYQAKVLPPLRPAAIISSRPVAVVRPTTQGSDVALARKHSKDDDAARRRLEGIERLRRNQEIADEVKGALKWFYQHKEITKEQYKYIYKKATEKIKQSSFPVESRSVSTLVRNYVKKMKGNQVDISAAK